MDVDEQEARAFVGLGSNLGDRTGHIDGALRELALLPKTALGAVSSLYESAPIDAEGGDYLNAVARLRTRLRPIELLRALLAIEARHGRTRPRPGAARSLDLDLLLHGTTRHESPELVLPHPRLHERAFVLVPLAEIAPRLHIPGRGDVETLLRALGAQRISKFTRP